MTDLVIMHAAISSPTAPLRDLRVSTKHPLGYIPHPFTMQALALRLSRQGYRGAITGPTGCGKTVMLQALGDELMGHGLTPLPLTIDPERGRALPTDWRRAIRKARPTDALLLDGFDLLPRWARAWVWFASMRAGAVVVTAERDVVYTALARPEPSAHLLEQLIDRVLPVSNLDIDCQALFEQSKGNLREALDIVNQRIQG